MSLGLSIALEVFKQLLRAGAAGFLAERTGIDAWAGVLQAGFVATTGVDFAVGFERMGMPLILAEARLTIAGLEAGGVTVDDGLPRMLDVRRFKTLGPGTGPLLVEADEEAMEVVTMADLATAELTSLGRGVAFGSREKNDGEDAANDLTGLGGTVARWMRDERSGMRDVMRDEEGGGKGRLVRTMVGDIVARRGMRETTILIMYQNQNRSSSLEGTFL